MDVLPITTQTAYAELVEQLLAIETRRSIGHAPGTFLTKTIKGKDYYYFQYSTPGGTTRQAYIGPKSKERTALVRRFEHERDALRADRQQVESLAAVLRAGGAGITDPASARVIRALAESGVFRLGGVLVGTHAFIVLGNMLGVRWGASSARTEDVDIAASKILEIAVPDLHADVPSALESLNMGFLPVPGFSPEEPSTSFKVRGRGLRVDLVTPSRSEAHGPVRIARFNAAAAPLRYLDYLIDDVQPGAVVDGGGILVNVPHPARFAVHKLLVAQDRPSAFQTKSKKDVIQAAHVLAALEELRPGDVSAAWRDAARRGPAWKRALQGGRRLLERHDRELAARLPRAVSSDDSD